MFKLIKITIFVILVHTLFFTNTVSAYNQDDFEYDKGAIFKILQEDEFDLDGLDDKEIYKKLEVKLQSGEIVEVEVRGLKSFTKQKYEIGDKVILSEYTNYDETKTYSIISYDRQNVLIFLFFIFLLLAFLVSSKKTIGALLGLVFSFSIIFLFLIPQILNGANPVILSIIASIFIIPITFYLSHGINRKTTIAIASTIIALVITGVLAKVFMSFAHITGHASEEAMFINTVINSNINIEGLLLAGVIIGTLGVLDDITISQAAIVQQITEVGKKLTHSEVFSRSMSIGRDHMASMINTLVLVYAGASMPILVIFVSSNLPLNYILSLETISMEIVRTLVGTIGLISAIPITTFLATIFFRGNFIRTSKPLQDLA